MNITHLLKKVGIGLAAIVGLVLLAVIAIYAWPLKDPALRSPKSTTYSYQQADARVRQLVALDTSDTAIKPDCRTTYLPQPQPTGKVVVLFHGYTPCPSQMSGLAATLFQRGYTVLIPRMIQHGYQDGRRVVPPASRMVSVVDDYVSVAHGLGADVGVIGISGGAVLSTWAAYYRPDVVKRLLVLSPFYEPNPKQAPRWQLKPLVTLYGGSVSLPDVDNGEYGTYKGLAQYQKIVANLPSSTRDLTSGAVVYSATDSAINVTVAVDRVRELYPAARTYQVPAEWGLDHDIVSPEVLKSNAANAYETYSNLYEDR
ncbi:MAG TPA: alpha/beta hydrolase [Candidatus Saccharimonadales bacterium]|jgi:carboxylesterase